MKSQISKTLIVFSVINLLIIIIWHKFYRVDLVGTITINEKQVNYVKYEKYLDSVNVVNTKYSDDIAVPATSTATKYLDRKSVV